MTTRNAKTDLNTFNRAMDTILKADPKAVKASMEADKAARAAGRTAQAKHVEEAQRRWDGIAEAARKNPKLQVPF